MMAKVVNLPLILQRMIAVSAFLVVLTLSIHLLAVLSAGIWHSDAQLQEKRYQFGRLAGAVRTHGSSPQQPELPTDKHQSTSSFLEASNRSNARSEMQARIAAIASANGVTLRSVDNSVDVEIGSVSYVSLSLDMAGKFEPIHSVIHQLETSDPVFSIDVIDMRSAVNRARKPDQMSVRARIKAPFVQTKLPGQAHGDRGGQ